MRRPGTEARYPPIPSDFSHILRLQPEEQARVGGTGESESTKARPPPIPSDFGHLLRLQPEEQAGVGGSDCRRICGVAGLLCATV